MFKTIKLVLYTLYILKNKLCLIKYIKLFKNMNSQIYGKYKVKLQCPFSKKMPTSYFFHTVKKEKNRYSFHENNDFTEWMRNIYSFPNSNPLNVRNLSLILKTTRLRFRLVRNYRRNFQIYLTKKNSTFLKNY